MPITYSIIETISFGKSQHHIHLPSYRKLNSSSCLIGFENKIFFERKWEVGGLQPDHTSQTQLRREVKNCRTVRSTLVCESWLDAATGHSPNATQVQTGLNEDWESPIIRQTPKDLSQPLEGIIQYPHPLTTAKQIDPSTTQTSYSFYLPKNATRQNQSSAYDAVYGK